MKIINGKEWTEKDCKILIELYPNESNKLIAIILNRTEIGVRKKAQKLGLKKTEKRLQQSRLENLKILKGGKK